MNQTADLIRHYTQLGAHPGMSLNDLRKLKNQKILSLYEAHQNSGNWVDLDIKVQSIQHAYLALTQQY